MPFCVNEVNKYTSQSQTESSLPASQDQPSRMINNLDMALYLKSPACRSERKRHVVSIIARVVGNLELCRRKVPKPETGTVETFFLGLNRRYVREGVQG